MRKKLLLSLALATLCTASWYPTTHTMAAEVTVMDNTQATAQAKTHAVAPARQKEV